jgi:hypothetical protein
MLEVKNFGRLKFTVLTLIREPLTLNLLFAFQP